MKEAVDCQKENVREKAKEEIPEEAKWITIEKDLEKGFSYRKIEIGERRK